MAQTRIQPLNIRTIKSAVAGAQQYVQDEKIKISRTTITKMQYADRWPEEYYSYVTSERRGNQYKDPAKFFRVMHSKPELYTKRFIFRPIIDTSGVIRKAAIEALAIAVRQANMFNVISGRFVSSFKMYVDGRLATVSDLDNLNSDSIVQIYNTAPYASTLEANAYRYRASIGGIVYYAAQKIKAAYPELGVRFLFTQANYLPDVNHIYATPVLTIGSRANVIDKVSAPGKRARRRRRDRRKAARIGVPT